MIHVDSLASLSINVASLDSVSFSCTISIGTQQLMVDAGAALLVHEYLITFHWEVELFWNRRMTGAVLLFLANRYVVLATLTFAVSGVMVSFPRDVRHTFPNPMSVLDLGC